MPTIHRVVTHCMPTSPEFRPVSCTLRLRYPMKPRTSCAILSGCGIKRKMTRIEDMDLGVRNVAAIGLRLREVER